MRIDPYLYINRELSWLQFNARVLHEAFDPRNRLLERVKFLSIFSTNLDEFFMVRVAGLRRQIAAHVHQTAPDGIPQPQQMEAIAKRVAELVEQQRKCLCDVLLPELEKHDIEIVGMKDLDERERARITEFFESQVQPVLTPMMLDSGDFLRPYVTNLALSVAVEIRDSATGKSRLGQVVVPKRLPRFVPFGRENHFVPLEQLIGANLDSLFPEMEIQDWTAFRVTRYSDLELPVFDDDDDLLTAIEEQVFDRRFGEVVRIEVEEGTSPQLRDLILTALQQEQPDDMLSAEDIVETGPLLDLGDLMWLSGMNIPELRDQKLSPATPPELADTSRSIFDVIRERDILVHHPFDSFSASVEHFLLSAARDPNVLSIKMTLYRTSGDTEIVRALTEAAQRGKRVAVVIELQARFDEINNIAWARALESSGVRVAYGLPGLKIHTKTALVVRKDRDGIRRYVHIGSGNYNSQTAHVYTDLGLFTADPDVAADLTDVFNSMTGFSRRNDFRNLLAAPRNMRTRFTEMIDREADHARKGRPGRIIAKMNALVDPEIIQHLYAASQAGVDIDLIVRGICCLRPGVPGVSDNISVISIVGRFLEHSRIFYFQNDGDEEVYFGSADWMPRNFDRRVEVVAPIEDRLLHARVCSLLEVLLVDNRQAWDLRPDGSYVQRKPGRAPVISAHERLVNDSWGLALRPVGDGDTRSAPARRKKAAGA
ncbi:MAG TPA: polyphosphate kinase 1 [Gemmatimonadaceae bacterium]|nr:polyphosphate kinase 1 [Gemmatimonadaceae bacterium]